MKIKVDVTAEDIAEGVPSSCTRCPISRAIQRLVVPRTVVFATLSGVSLINGSEIRRTDLPDAASRFILAFDHSQCEPVSPFSFELEASHLYPFLKQ